MYGPPRGRGEEAGGPQRNTAHAKDEADDDTAHVNDEADLLRAVSGPSFRRHRRRGSKPSGSVRTSLRKSGTRWSRRQAAIKSASARKQALGWGTQAQPQGKRQRRRRARALKALGEKSKAEPRGAPVWQHERSTRANQTVLCEGSFIEGPQQLYIYADPGQAHPGPGIGA